MRIGFLDLVFLDCERNFFPVLCESFLDLMSRRSQSRQAAVQVLFQDDFNRDRSREFDRGYLKEQLGDDVELMDLAWQLIDGTRRYQVEVDQAIDASADHWELGRISAIDRSILRLAVFEVQFAHTPGPVAIDEAIRLAKRFGGKESPRFVNGVLDAVLKQNSSKKTATADSGKSGTSAPGKSGTSAPGKLGTAPAAPSGSGLRRFLNSAKPPKE